MNEETTLTSTQKEIQEKSKIKVCPNCGEKLLSDSFFCIKCGTKIEENQIIPDNNNKFSIFTKHKKKIISTISAIIAIFIVAFVINSIQKSNLKKQLMRDWEDIEGDNGSYILCILDFSDDEIKYRIETGYKWMDTTIATYNYKVISGNKIKVNRFGDNWETVKIEFDDDKTMMTVTPALTSMDAEEQWFNFD